MPNPSHLWQKRVEFEIARIEQQGLVKTLLDPKTGETMYVLTKAGREQRERET